VIVVAISDQAGEGQIMKEGDDVLGYRTPPQL
jgi:hypothetical protein